MVLARRRGVAVPDVVEEIIELHSRHGRAVAPILLAGEHLAQLVMFMMPGGTGFQGRPRALQGRVVGDREAGSGVEPVPTELMAVGRFRKSCWRVVVMRRVAPLVNET